MDGDINAQYQEIDTDILILSVFFIIMKTFFFIENPSLIPIWPSNKVIITDLTIYTWPTIWD